MAFISRRDFLKTALSLSAGAALFPLLSSIRDSVRKAGDKPNIIIMVFDAMTARNLSLYGYPRKTTPNLERLAQRATVYHSHYSAGNFTTPGTASMLTGTYPWTHRAINIEGMVARKLADNNLFSYLQDDYYCTVFTQNFLAEVLLNQFAGSVDRHLVMSSFRDKPYRAALSSHFPNDPIVALQALDELMLGYDRSPASLVFGFIDRIYGAKARQSGGQPAGEYPYGLPDNYFSTFLNEAVYAGVLDEIRSLADDSAPFLGYFHLWSPHWPFAPRKEFVNTLPEIQLPEKPVHKLSENDLRKTRLKARRKAYDEYLLEVDFEIGRLVDALESDGILQNSYLILTSDHGEVFERGEWGHGYKLLYDPVIHIPLLVMAPGQQNRQDIYATTSNIDLVPTLLHIAGKQPLNKIEGRILPGFGGTDDPERSIFSIEAKENSSFGPLKKATVSMTKGDHKLIYYLGYEKYPDGFELYNLREDGDEMNDIFQRDAKTAARMKEELLDQLADKNNSIR